MIEVQLSKPIKAHGEEITTLAISDEPTVRHLKIYEKAGGGVAGMAAAIAELAKLPMSSVDAIAPRDFVKISKALEPFFDDGQETGGN